MNDKPEEFNSEIDQAIGKAYGMRKRPTGEACIVHENGDYWVHDDGRQYSVMRTGVTHSTSDSHYARTEDGRSIAIARCDYLAGQLRASTRVLMLWLLRDFL